MSEDYVSFSKSGCRKLAYAVLRSGLKSRDKLFFESGLYRFYMDFLDFTSLRNLTLSIKEMADNLNWNLPPYPMNVQDCSNLSRNAKKDCGKNKNLSEQKGGQR